MMSMKFLQVDGRVAALNSLPRGNNTPRVLGTKLGGIKRFQGYHRAYTVLEHTLAMARVAELEDMGDAVIAACLTHDITEAYTGDINGRIKHCLTGLDEVDFAIRAGLEAVGWFIIDSPSVMGVVHELDSTSVLAERSLMMPGLIITEGGPHYASMRERLERMSGSLLHQVDCYVRMCQYYGAFQ
jgi:hypothetical protein